jgi:hypothetical protein
MLSLVVEEKLNFCTVYDDVSRDLHIERRCFIMGGVGSCVYIYICIFYHLHNKLKKVRVYCIQLYGG